MNADAKLATRENVSAASALVSVTGAPHARRITQASSAMSTYDAAVAATGSRRVGLPPNQIERLPLDDVAKRATLLSRERRPECRSIRWRSDCE